MMSVDPLEVEVGYGLIPIVDEASGGGLLDRITHDSPPDRAGPRHRAAHGARARQPPARPERLRGQAARRRDRPRHADAGQYLAMDPGTAEGDIPGIRDHRAGLRPARALDHARPTRSARNCSATPWSMPSPCSPRTSPSSSSASRQTCSAARTPRTCSRTCAAEYPALVEDLVPDHAHRRRSAGGAAEPAHRTCLHPRPRDHLRNARHPRRRITRDIDLLTEYARAALARQISRQHADDAGTLTSSPSARAPRTRSPNPSSSPSVAARSRMPPWQLQRLLGVVGTEVERVASSGRDPIILCSSRIRLALRRLLERRLPNVASCPLPKSRPKPRSKPSGNIEVNVGN